METKSSGTTSSVLRNQRMEYSGEPESAQDRITVLPIPVFSFFGVRVTCSGSVKHKQHNPFKVRRRPK